MRPVSSDATLTPTIACDSCGLRSTCETRDCNSETVLVVAALRFSEATGVGEADGVGVGAGLENGLGLGVGVGLATTLGPTRRWRCGCC